MARTVIEMWTDYTPGGAVSPTRKHRIDVDDFLEVEKGKAYRDKYGNPTDYLLSQDWVKVRFREDRVKYGVVMPAADFDPDDAQAIANEIGVVVQSAAKPAQ